MSFQFSPYTTPLFLAALVMAALAWYAWRRRSQLEAFIFALVTTALSWWLFFYALSICGADLETQYLFNRLKYIGLMAVPPLWVILALQHTQHQSVLTRRNMVLIFLPAGLLLPIVLTDHLTHLWWPDIWLGTFGGRPVLEHTHGTPYFIHMAVSYLYIVWGSWLYVRFHWRTQRIYRTQAILVSIAAIVPLLASVLSQLGFSPFPWGLDGFFFALSSLLILFTMMRSSLSYLLE